MYRFIFSLRYVAFLCLVLSLFSGMAFAQQHAHHSDGHLDMEQATFQTADEPFDPMHVIMPHIQDAHDFHLWGEGHDAVSIPLPVILKTQQGFVGFLSSAFHHDNAAKQVVEKKGMLFVRFDEKIYQLHPQETSLKLSDEGAPLNAVLPIDLSFTKHVFSMFFSLLLLFGLFVFSAMRYAKTNVPTGVSSFLEPIVLFVRDEIAKPNLGDKADKYLPYLLTIFFFIWANNLLGLLPLFPGSANVMGDVAVTFTLATLTFIITNLSANKHYWQHIFAMPGLPKWLLPIMIPIEIIGMFSKPFSLMVRLAVNISAGHIIMLSIISLVFVFRSVAWGGFTVPFALFMNCLELLVAFLQAYVFTLLSSLFIGMAIEEHHHEESHH
jgi:F-type H+-transporting ATPase subunit a